MSIERWYCDECQGFPASAKRHWAIFYSAEVVFAIDGTEDETGPPEIDVDNAVDYVCPGCGHPMDHKRPFAPSLEHDPDADQT